jgi:putative tricarboxylic transport membrane protein
MNALDRGSCIFLLAFSIFIGLLSLQLGIGGLELMGAGFMPFLASILLFLLSSIVLIKGWRGKQKQAGDGSHSYWEEMNKPLMLIGALIVYAFFLKLLGYILMTFVLVYFLFFMMQPKKWRMDLFFAALVSILSFVLFDNWLNVRLPAGLLTMIR